MDPYHSHLTVQRQIITSLKGCGKLEPSHIAEANINWHSRLGERFLKRLKLPHDLAIPFPGMETDPDENSHV